MSGLAQGCWIKNRHWTNECRAGVRFQPLSNKCRVGACPQLSLLGGIVFLLGSILLALGCGDSSGGNRLYGSASQTYNLDFDQVDVYRQENAGQFVAIVVKYVFKPENSSLTRVPVKIVVNAPVAANQEKNLLTEGALERLMQKSDDFPKMKMGKITFEDLGAVGERVSGKFYITFQEGTTLNGEFETTLQKL